MVDPKKEYELLMRYLQGGALRREPVTIPEKGQDSWQPAPQPGNVSQNQRPYFNGKSVFKRLRSGSKKQNITFPKLKLLAYFTRIRVLIAAVAILVLTITTWKAYIFYQLTPDSIFAKLYIPYAATSENQHPPASGSIGHFYATGNYVGATMQSKKQKQHSDKEKLLTGLANLHRDDYSAAIKWLEPLSNNFKTPYRQQAEYYLVLAFLKNEDFDRCIEKMEQIAYTPSHPYHNYISKSIIQDIKMLKWK